jgi:serine protease AprX
LMISANPQLAGQVDTIEKILELTCRPMQTTQNCGTISGLSVPNHTYGWGRINVYAAIKKGLLYRRPTTKTVDYQQFVKVSPNPFSTEIRFYTEGVVGETSVTIFNMNGQVVSEKNAIFTISNQLTIDIANAPIGIYFYRVNNKSGILSGKLIKM